MEGPLITVDRRVTLQWLAAAFAVGELAACAPKKGEAAWPVLEPIKAKGYGMDPDLDKPVVPWPLTLTKAELLTVAAAADLIMPADGTSPSASQVGVPAFINEWVSAPYKDQQKDRGLIVPGLAWLDKQARAKNAASFASAPVADQKAVLDDIAWTAKVKPGLEKPAAFFKRLRSLTVGAYFSSDAGWKDLGYPGNTPFVGAYPGPTPEAIAHMKKTVEAMGLKFTPP